MNDPSVVLAVRPATAEDIPSIIEMQVASVADSVAAVVGEQFREQVKRQLPQDQMAQNWSQAVAYEGKERGVLVARENDRVVGFTAFAVESVPQAGTPGDSAESDTVEIIPGVPYSVPANSAQILAFEVAEADRHAGHGSRMLAGIADSAKLASIPGLVVWVVGEDAERVRFFQKAGFAPLGVRRTVETGAGEVTEHLWFASLD